MRIMRDAIAVYWKRKTARFVETGFRTVYEMIYIAWEKS